VLFRSEHAFCLIINRNLDKFLTRPTKEDFNLRIYIINMRVLFLGYGRANLLIRARNFKKMSIYIKHSKL
jgi:hypothetical protein